MGFEDCLCEKYVKISIMDEHKHIVGSAKE